MTAAEVLADALDAGRGDDVRLALHEAGHVAFAWLVGGEVTGPVSISGRYRWAGVTHVRVSRITSDLSAVDWGQPMACWPPDFRRTVGFDCMLLQVGELAERVWLPAPRACRGQPEAEQEVADVRGKLAVRRA